MTKKYWLLTIVAFAAFLFASCSNLISEKVTDAAFVCDSNFTSVVRSAINVSDTENITIRFEFTGAYQKTVEQTVPINNLKGSKFEFAGIPLNKAFDIYIAVFWKEELLFEGSQTGVKISSSNPNLELSIVLKKLLNTKYVLYNCRMEESVETYNYWLGDSVNAAVPEAFEVSATGVNSFTFDSKGNFYAIKSNGGTTTVYYDNEDDIEIKSVTLHNIAVDRAQNVFYGFSAQPEAALEVYKFPNLIFDGNTNDSSSTSVDFYNLQSFSHICYTVNDGILYDVGTSRDAGTRNLYLVTVDINDENTTDYNYAENKINLTEELALPNSDNMTVTDILYQDGAVYILVKETKDSFSGDTPPLTYFNRGAVLKYDCITGAVSKLGWSDSSISNKGKFYVKLNNATLYKDKTSNYATHGYSSEDAYKADSANWASFAALPSTDEKDYSVNIYAPYGTNSTQGFYGPQKFIAIKPKKLVIADDGIAFYTDANGAFRAKNVNRVVTVDLEKFAITDCTNVSATFEKDATSDITSSGYGKVSLMVTSGGIYLEGASGSSYVAENESNTINGENGMLALNIPLDTNE